MEHEGEQKIPIQYGRALTRQEHEKGGAMRLHVAAPKLIVQVRDRQKENYVIGSSLQLEPCFLLSYAINYVKSQKYSCR